MGFVLTEQYFTDESEALAEIADRGWRAMTLDVPAEENELHWHDFDAVCPRSRAMGLYGRAALLGLHRLRVISVLVVWERGRAKGYCPRLRSPSPWRRAHRHRPHSSYRRQPS